ncbi:MAG: hypothetical protein WBE13_16050 [Candidatus Acidiferrum sp.]
MNQKSSETPGTDAKKTYKKPDFRFERVFAVAAIQCGKVNTTVAQCFRVPKAS